MATHCQCLISHFILKKWLVAHYLFSCWRILWYRLANQFHADICKNGSNNYRRDISYYTKSDVEHSHFNHVDYILIKVLVTQYRRLHLLRYHIRNLVYDKNFIVSYDRLSGWTYVSFDVCDKVVTTFRPYARILSCNNNKRNDNAIICDFVDDFILI